MAKRSHKVRKQGAGGANVALPALSSLQALPSFSQLSPSDGQRGAFGGAWAEEPDVPLGCVVRLDRGFPAIAWEGGLVRAEFSASLTKGDDSRVAVGDWVAVRVPEGHDKAQLEAILPRESDVARWRGKARGERQTLAANVDVVLVAQALGERALNVDRIARSAVIARDCGARVAVVLTKADRVSREALAASLAQIRAVLGSDVPLVVTAAGDKGGDKGVRDFCLGLPDEGSALPSEASVPQDDLLSFGTEGLLGLVPTGTVAIVLGESGAGMSTLLNALLGSEVLQTGAVRERDDAGRHTTVARRMVALPRAGVIVDEPGLRSLPLVGHERGLAKVFPKISDAACGCRFRDCTHTHEPGCAVREALAEGAFTPQALDAYLALAAEMRQSAAQLDPDVVL